MDTILRGLPHTFCYIDDILVASSTEEEHIADLRAVFTRMQQHELVIHPDKCTFGAKTLEFLGHTVSEHGIQPSPSKVEAIAAFPRPDTVKSLQQFLGMVNFYHRFIPRAAQVLQPLYESLKRTGTNNSLLNWTPEMNEAFKDGKTLLCKATLLVHPDMAAPIALTVDASNVATGAVLEQQVNGFWQPLAFFSRQLRSPETKYSTFDRELLGVYLAVKQFRYYLEGRQFTVYTDHKPLVSAMSNTPTLSPPASNDIYPTYQNSPPTCSTYPARTMLLRTASREPVYQHL